MKQKIIIPIGYLILGLLIGGGIVNILYSTRITEKEKEIKKLEWTLSKARESIIIANTEYNSLFNQIGIIAIKENNQYASVAAITLQKIMPLLLDVNKNLNIDCKEYNNGEPIMTQDQYGFESPCEVLPEELRIVD